MAFNILDKGLQTLLERHLSKARRSHNDALEKLSSGQVFTKNDPRPADRALAEGLEFKLRSLTSSKRNINSAVNLLQTAESSLSEITNMVIRMKEINIAGASTTVSDEERRYLFVEYEALHDEINRIALTTEFNGIPLLNGESEETPEELVFRVGDPSRPDGDFFDGDDINAIRFDGLSTIVATTEGLGLQSAAELLSDIDEEDGGIPIEDVEELMIAEDDDIFETAYDQALNSISTHRAVFGAMQARLHRALDFIDVYQENLTAAKSNISDTDYAHEVGRMVENRLLMQAGTAVMAHGNINAQLALNLLNSSF